MRAVFSAGVVHAVVGGSILFLTLHPLRDALDAHALDLAKTGGAWQAMQGLGLMAAAAATRARIGPLLIAFGAALSAATLYFIAFSGHQPPFIVLVPIGGAISMLGWILLLFAPLRRTS